MLAASRRCCRCCCSGPWGGRGGGSAPPPPPPAATPAATPAPRHNASRPEFPCGGQHRGESGFIASEGFPRHYPPGRNCTWTITVPEGQVATLSFRVFDLEPDPRCRFDSLSVFGGHGPGAPLLGRFCGTFRPGALRAAGNRLLLRMESDAATAGRGFLAWFSAGLPPAHGEPGRGAPPAHRRDPPGTQGDPPERRETPRNAGRPPGMQGDPPGMQGPPPEWTPPGMQGDPPGMQGDPPEQWGGK
ncbi:procollagen C-endopeptidase enhancer 2-like [Phalacrocorax carbo]|uniref:procollagen C-endopeptidase enhancer 2-like n=1 Tax=Phalacrocorax carbo TaxID=9209 RepID=UPI003119E769